MDVELIRDSTSGIFGDVIVIDSKVYSSMVVLIVWCCTKSKLSSEQYIYTFMY